MSSSGVSLLQIPEIPMKHILEYLEFPSILILRKVCHDLRNFIDDTKPAFHLKEIHVTVYPEYISFILESRAQNKIHIFYEKCNEGCLIKKCQKRKEIKRTTLENEDFVAVFCKDLDIILRHQKTALEYFGIYFSNSTVKEKVLESINMSLKSMNHLLQVKSLYMTVDDHNELLTVLPYIDPKPLELIHIGEASNRDTHMLNLNEIGQLEQWKQADELIIRGLQLRNLAPNIKHCSNIDLGYREIPIEELILLKEIFLRSSTLNTIKIFYDYNYKDHIKQGLIETFEKPFLDKYQDEYWFFTIPDTNQFLRITCKCANVHFNRIEQSDVPQYAIILN